MRLQNYHQNIKIILKPKLDKSLVMKTKTGIYSVFLLLMLGVLTLAGWKHIGADDVKLYKASDKNFQYVGRVDFTNKDLPKFWNPGVYIKAKFSGTSCEIDMNDQQSETNMNYISVQIDDMPVKRIELKSKVNTLMIAEGLEDKPHNITICKTTEAGNGYLEFVGLKVAKLNKPDPLPKRKVEFFGDSITSGTGSDVSEFPCNTPHWYDQHNAYMSYGPLTARALNAQWQLTAIAGIGLTKSCCKMNVIMPDVYNKMDVREGKGEYDMNLYKPDVLTICLGQNDGIVDSVKFCAAYVNLIGSLRAAYPKTTMVCLTSPMANDKLTKVQKNYLAGVIDAVNKAGDKKVYKYYFTKHWNAGCGGHPSIAQHQEIADELTAFIKQTMNW